MNLLRHSRELNPLIRMVRVLLLLGWLLSSHGIAPAICLVAAVLDGDHAVKVGLTNEGALTVVLSHAGKSPAELTAHEHDTLCRVLVAFAAAPSSGAEDHVLAFKPVDDASRTQQPMPSMQSIGKTAAPVLTAVFCRTKTPSSESIGRHVRSDSWSHGIALKSGRTVMRC
jgi:hypothetical protein